MQEQIRKALSQSFAQKFTAGIESDRSRSPIGSAGGMRPTLKEMAKKKSVVKSSKLLKQEVLMKEKAFLEKKRRENSLPHKVIKRDDALELIKVAKESLPESL